MKIALAQMDISWEEKKENKKRCEEFCRMAVEQQADLIVFPEMTLTGFSMNIVKTGEVIEQNQSETIAFFQRLAMKYEIRIGFGMVEGTRKAKNRYYIVDAAGEIQLDYAKIHPFTYGDEGKFFVGGEDICYAQLEDITYTVFICYDLRFPEIFQAAAKQTQLILVPANWPKERQQQYELLLKARAIETQCYVAGVNRVGNGNGLEYVGGSTVIDPYGKEISFCVQSNKMGDLILAEIEADVVADYRRKFPVLEDRREELYKNI